MSLLQEPQFPQHTQLDFLNDPSMDKLTIWEVAAKVMGNAPRDPEINPFLKNFTIETKGKTVNAKTEEVFAQEADGSYIEVDNEAREIRHIKYVDKGQFVKVMNAAFKAAFGLSSKGQRMFWLVMSELSENPGKDSIFLTYNKEFIVNNEAITLPKTSFYDGLKALQDANFIAPKRERGFYWVNPAMLWNGDRVKLSTTYILKHGENHPDMPVVKRPGKDGARGRRRRSSKAA